MKSVSELLIIDEKNSRNIFSDARYFVPLYQRGYAWEDTHINQLIDDIMDLPSGDGKYFIGSLIIHHRNNKDNVAFEVIDGQQRLTTLFLLLKYLKELDANSKALRFDCREKSNLTLDRIADIVGETATDEIDSNSIQQELVAGYKIISDKIKSEKIDTKLLKEKLGRTVIYRIEVPEHTDLNHYFEIMNTRGEQLEQSDVLKARLMAHLQCDKMWQTIFATIWDACRNMDGYVQMHFPKHVRERIFGSQWHDMPETTPEDYNSLQISPDQDKGLTILQAIKDDFNKKSEEGYNEDNHNDRFESIIDFSYFLLHTLRVFIHEKNISPDENLLERLLDDKKLVESFEKVRIGGQIDGKPIGPAVFVKEFAGCLLRTRYLFDRYIIKREFVGDAVQDGEWSLKELKSNGQGGNKKAVYNLSNVSSYNQRNNDKRNKEILMLQAAMRVSYTSPKVMHWITDLLIWLTDNFHKEEWNFKEQVNSIARRPVKDFLANELEQYSGVATSHMVLNYLDYLLWEQDKQKDFDFEFRNSVEHWYPRNPSEGSFGRWDDDGPEGVNRFGNLCLIQRNVNSKFSNMHPGAKKSTFLEMIGKGSLKLRKMSEMTSDTDSWRNETCACHEEEMLNLLRQACSL